MSAEKVPFGEEREAMETGGGSIYENQESTSTYEMSLFIEELEDLVDAGASVPFTSKILIDQEQAVDTLQILRANMPWEMLEAKRIISQQKEVLDRAEVEAKEIRQLAERQAAFILDQSQLVNVAEVRAQEMIEGAEQQAAKTLLLAEKDARDLYLGLERELDLLVRDIKGLLASRLDQFGD